MNAEYQQSGTSEFKTPFLVENLMRGLVSLLKIKSNSTDAKKTRVSQIFVFYNTYFETNQIDTGHARDPSQTAVSTDPL